MGFSLNILTLMGLSLSVGLLIERKGHHLVIEALKHVREVVFPWLKDLGEQGSSFERYMGNAELKINKPALLIEACKLIEGMQIASQNQDVQGDLYEYLLERLSIAGRTFENCDGHINMPDGEVFTGPVEDSVEGMVSFTYPAIYYTREVQGVRLWFEKGKIVKAQADKGEDYLVKTLDTDAGARYVGEFAIGTNDGITRFTRQILFDEKIGGSFHMAMGSGYPETGSKNDSAIHWDMICDLRQGGQITVDGQLMYKDGKFVI